MKTENPQLMLRAGNTQEKQRLSAYKQLQKLKKILAQDNIYL